MQLLVPVTSMPNARMRPAERPAPGKPLKIGMLHNCKPNGDIIMQSVFDMLAVKGLAADAIACVKHTAGEPAKADILEQLKDCDLVLTGLAC
jgi:hypothetical protein